MRAHVQAAGRRPVGDGGVAAAGSQRDVLVALERDEPEDRHEALAELELVHAGGELARAAAAEVVQQVVAVGRDAQLAQPALDRVRRRFGIDGTVDGGLPLPGEVVAREVRGALLGSGAPPADGIPEAHARRLRVRRRRAGGMAVRMRLAACLLLAAALGCAGCGGDDGDGSPSAPDRVLTKAEYEKAYRATSEDNDEKVEELRDVFRSAGRDETDKIAAALEDFAKFTREDAQALDALRPPADIADEHQRFVDLMGRLADTYEKTGRRVREASSFEEAQLELLSIQEFLVNKQKVPRAFQRAIEKGDYDLGTGVTLPGQPTP